MFEWNCVIREEEYDHQIAKIDGTSNEYTNIFQHLYPVQLGMKKQCQHEAIQQNGLKTNLLGNGHLKFLKKERRTSVRDEIDTSQVKMHFTMQCDALKCTRVELTWSVLISSSVERAQDRRNNF